jgi:hypothetical protein
MNVKPQWLRLVAPLTLLAACSSSLTEPTLGPPKDASKLYATTCTGAECVSDAPPGYVNLDTYPYVETQSTASADKEFGDIPIGPSALTTTTPPPECTTTIEQEPFPLWGAPEKYYAVKPSSCPTGPCYGQYLDARDAYRMMVAGIAGGVIVAAVTYVSPATGYAVRIMKTAGSFVGTSGVVGWANKSRYDTALWKLSDCVNLNSSGYYHVTVYK